jgi:hypothetical protein
MKSYSSLSLIFFFPVLLWAEAKPSNLNLSSNEFNNCTLIDKSLLAWMDYQHCILSKHSIKAAASVDDLFGSWYENDARMFVRAIVEENLYQYEENTTKFKLRVNVALPKLEKKARLIISSNERTRTNQEEINTTDTNTNSLSLALRWIVTDYLGMKSDLDTGVRGGTPIDLYVRYRLNKDMPLTSTFNTRLEQSFRYGTAEGYESITQLSAEYKYTSNSLIRQTNIYDHQEGSDVLVRSWTHSISQFTQITDQSFINFGVSLQGKKAENWHPVSYGPFFSYRNALYKNWIYYEVEPSLQWQKARDWNDSFSLTGRIEFQFGKK